MRITQEERRLIETLAEREERSASDIVRRLIRKSAQRNERAPRRQTESAPVGATVLPQ
jgi:negative regulator of replication initiation